MDQNTEISDFYFPCTKHVSVIADSCAKCRENLQSFPSKNVEVQTNQDAQNIAATNNNSCCACSDTNQQQTKYMVSSQTQPLKLFCVSPRQIKNGLAAKSSRRQSSDHPVPVFKQNDAEYNSYNNSTKGIGESLLVNEEDISNRSHHVDHGQVAQSAEYMCSVMETYQKIFEPREYHCPLCKSAIKIKSEPVAEKISQFCCDKYIRPVEETNQKRIFPNPQEIDKKSTSTQFTEDAFPQNKALPGNKPKCCIRINDDAQVLSEYKTRGPSGSSIKFGPERTKTSGTQPSCCYENSASRTVIKNSSNKLPKIEDREMISDDTPLKSIDAEVYVNNVPPQLVNKESSNNIQESNSKSTSESLLNTDNNQDVSNMNGDSLPPNENSKTKPRGRSRNVMLSKSGMAKEIPSCCYENKPNNRTTSFTQAEKSSNEIHKEDVVDDQLVLTSSDSRMKFKDSFKSERISKQVPSCCFKNKSADYTSLSLPIKEVVSSTEAERDESSKESYEDRQSSSEVVPAVDQLPSNENSKSKFNEPSGDLIISRSELTKSSEQTTSSSCTDPHLRISDVKMNDDNAQRKGKSSDDIPFESASYEDNQCTTDSPYVTFYGNSQVIMKEPSDAAKSQLPSCCHKKESGVSRSASVAKNNYPEATYDERREIVRTPSQFIDDLISNFRVVIETFNLKPGYFPQKEPVRQKCPDHRLPRNRNSPGCCSCLSSHSIEELL